MTNYREIIRLKCQGYSERNIALSCSVSQNTVSKVCKAAAKQNIAWPLNEAMTDAVLENMLFPSEKSATNKRMPNYDYIRRELQRNGVNKKLLWTEYCEECSQCGEEPLPSSVPSVYADQLEHAARSIRADLPLF